MNKRVHVSTFILCNMLTNYDIVYIFKLMQRNCIHYKIIVMQITMNFLYLLCNHFFLQYGTRL